LPAYDGGFPGWLRAPVPVISRP